jgi:hypothetical protein
LKSINVVDEMPDEPVVLAPVLVPFTCEWAKAGLASALKGMSQSGGGVLEYHIGSRGLKREGSKSQIDNVGYWNEMVRLYCGEDVLPSSLTGRDAACRIIPRDL